MYRLLYLCTQLMLGGNLARRARYLVAQDSGRRVRRDSSESKICVLRMEGTTHSTYSETRTSLINL